ASRAHVAKAGLAPIALDRGERMPRVEVLDARAEERADRGPSCRHQTTSERQPDTRVQPPERPPHAGGQRELHGRDASPRLEDAVIGSRADRIDERRAPAWVLAERKDRRDAVV